MSIAKIAYKEIRKALDTIEMKFHQRVECRMYLDIEVDGELFDQIELEE